MRYSLTGISRYNASPSMKRRLTYSRLAVGWLKKRLVEPDNILSSARFAIVIGNERP